MNRCGDGVSQRMRESGFWDGDDFFSVPRSVSQSLGLPDNIADIFESGVPSWVAPNMNLTPPVERGAREFEFGSDRDDGALVIEAEGLAVLCIYGVTSRFVNTSFEQFMECVFAYAEMIEKALRIAGKSAAVDNRIPDALIHEFAKNAAKIDLFALKSESFWSCEIGRRLSHAADS